MKRSKKTDSFESVSNLREVFTPKKTRVKSFSKLDRMLIGLANLSFKPSADNT